MSDAPVMRSKRIVLALGFLYACGGPNDTPDDGPPDSGIDAPAVPVFRNPVSLSDTDLATQSLQILGADVPGHNDSSCNGCHGLTKQRIRYWRALSDSAMTTCLTDLAVSSQQSAQTMIDCAREMPALATSDFQAKKLGIYATAARLPWFQYTFWVAFGDDNSKLTDFQAHAGMPKNGVTPLTQAQFDIVAEWFVRGLPKLDTTLVTDPPPNTCEPSISADVAMHVTAMATAGWRTVNRNNNMNMFGCGAQTDPNNPDSDGDGINDGVEDADQDGALEVNETDPTESNLNLDSDGDGLLDIVENGDTGGTNQTDPFNRDSDEDGIVDGIEDANRDGSFDEGPETDPNNTVSDRLCDGVRTVVDVCVSGEDNDNNGQQDSDETDHAMPTPTTMPSATALRCSTATIRASATAASTTMMFATATRPIR